MISVEGSVVIRRPVDEVFAFVSDSTQDPKWQIDVVEAHRASDGPVGVGSTFRWLLNYMNSGPEEATAEVTAFDPGRSEQLRIKAGPMTQEIAYLVEPADGGTRFTRCLALDHPLLSPDTEAEMGPRIRHRNAFYLQNLKNLLEAGVTAAAQRLDWACQ